MSIDIMHVQVLALLIAIVITCHMPRPQPSIKVMHLTVADKPEKQRLHITEVHVSQSFYIFQYTREVVFAIVHGKYIIVGTGKWSDHDIKTLFAHVLDRKLGIPIRLLLLKYTSIVIQIL